MFRKSIIFAAALTFFVVAASCAGASTTVINTVTAPGTTVTLPPATQTVTATATSPGATVTFTKPVTVTVTGTPPTSTPPTSTTPTPTGPVTTTAGQLALTGAQRYVDNCTYTYCHHKFGEGGEEEFSQFRVSYFTDAQDMFTFTKSFMHHPDTQTYLTDDQYVEVLAYILTQNGMVDSSTHFGLGNLSTIKLQQLAPMAAGTLAISGAQRYEANCTYTYCHYKWSDGGDQDFTNFRLSYFSDAQDLLTFIKSFMHHPDTKTILSDDQYLEIIAFILTENGTLQPTDLISVDNLSTIPLTQ
jgi:hypothetical protein